MKLSSDPNFDAPIPGESLTMEVGSRPWQNPSQYSTVDEVIEYYMARMTTEEFMVQLVDILEMGVPVAVLANTIQMSSVMEGVHNIDTGMLVLPILVEMIMLLGDSAGVKYNSGLDAPEKGQTRESLLAKVATKYKSKLEDVDLEKAREEQETIEEEKEDVQYSSGLMSRRA